MKIIFLSILMSSFLSGADFQTTWNSIQQHPYKTLPQYEVSYLKLFNDEKSILTANALRTLHSTQDILPNFEKLVHPNGICFKGIWHITQENIFSGYFKKDTLAPIIVRISSAMSNTKSGELRSFGFAGKIFPTSNSLTKSANFFLIDDLGGSEKKFFSQTSLSNAPDISFNIGIISHLFYALEVTKTFSKVDINPTIRQLYEISSLDEKEKNIITPKYMKLILQTPTNHTTKDFRKELSLKNGKKLIFKILISSDKKQWKMIGNINLDSSICSLSCDKKLHFHHPKFKENLKYR